MVPIEALQVHRGAWVRALPETSTTQASDHDRLAGMRYGPLRQAHNGQGRGGPIGIEALGVLSGIGLYRNDEQCYDPNEPSQTIEGALNSSHLRHSSYLVP